MSRSKKGSKGCGWDYWGKRPLYGSGYPDRSGNGKQIGIQRERAILKEELNGIEISYVIVDEEINFDDYEYVSVEDLENLRSKDIWPITLRLMNHTLNN